jgi:E3 ubiquitin-protein ligase RNF220
MIHLIHLIHLTISTKVVLCCWTNLLKMEKSISREPDEKRHRRQTSLDPVTCPICGITIRENELEQHYTSELEKLGKIKKILNKNPLSTSPGTSKCKAGEKSDSVENDAKEHCWETFQKIKDNRVRRFSKVRKKLNCVLTLTYASLCSSRVAKERWKTKLVPSALKS